MKAATKEMNNRIRAGFVETLQSLKTQLVVMLKDKNLQFLQHQCSKSIKEYRRTIQQLKHFEKIR